MEIVLRLDHATVLRCEWQAAEFVSLVPGLLQLRQTATKVTIGRAYLDAY
jgi:hypothetical protein